MSTHKAFPLAVGTVLLALCATAQGANLEAGRAKAKEVCAACHGEDGNSPVADYPKLSGQHSDYLAKALRDYKSGARKNPIMAPMAAALSNQDIENLAAWYHAQKAALGTRN